MTGTRIDKWLWAARFFKTREQASKACDMNRITSNHLSAKPSREVRTGDMLHIKNEAGEFEIEVLALSQQRGSAAIAQTAKRKTAKRHVAKPPKSASSWAPSPIRHPQNARANATAASSTASAATTKSLLRGGRSLRDAYTGLGRSSAEGLPLVGAIRPRSIARTHTRYTSHEVTAPRAVGPSGRTQSLIVTRHSAAHNHQNPPHHPLPHQPELPPADPTPSAP
jgi:ribosome-associated heat shock protein Hsp15